MTQTLAYRRVSVAVGTPLGQGLRLSSEDGFRIAFEVQFTARKRPNTAKVILYNLKDSQARALEEPGINLSVVAGYRDVQGVVMAGDIVQAEEVWKKTDRIITLTIKDAGRLYRDATFNASFGAGTTNRQIVSRILSSLNLAAGFGVSELPLVSYAEELTFTGPLRKTLDEIAADAGVEWSLQAGALQFLGGPDQSTPQNGVLLNSHTGLLSAARKPKGVELVGLLQPSILPGRLLRVQGKSVVGDFVAREVTHKGDSDRGKHTTSITARRIA